MLMLVYGKCRNSNCSQQGLVQTFLAYFDSSENWHSKARVCGVYGMGDESWGKSTFLLFWALFSCNFNVNRSILMKIRLSKSQNTERNDSDDAGVMPKWIAILRSTLGKKMMITRAQSWSLGWSFDFFCFNVKHRVDQISPDCAWKTHPDPSKTYLGSTPHLSTWFTFRKKCRLLS